MNDSGRGFRARYTIAQPHVLLSATRPVTSQAMPVDLTVPPHDHDFYEICLVTDGSARHLTRQGGSAVRAGHVIVVAPAQVHGFVRCDGLRVINIYYLSEWLLGGVPWLTDQDGIAGLFLQQSLFPNLPAGDVVDFRLDLEQLRACVSEVRQLSAESSRQEPSPIYLRACLMKAMVTLARAYRETGRPRPTPLRDAQVARLIELIEAAIAAGEPLRLAQAAESLGISCDHVARRFRRATGMSPTAYFQRRRVQRAAAMLLEGRHDVTEIAHALGYADAAHLSRLFRKHQGVSPRAYRRMYSSGTMPGSAADGGI